MKKYIPALAFLISTPLFADLGGLRLAISSAESKISSTRSYISQARADASNVSSEAGTLRFEAARLDQDALRYQRDYSENIRLNESAVIEGRKLADEVTVLMKKIAEQDYKIGNLKTTEQRIQTILTSSDRIRSKLVQLEQDFQNYHELHLTWMRDSNLHIENSRPDFDAITDKKSYVNAYLKVLDASRYFPNMGAVINAENQLYNSIPNLIFEIESMQRTIREAAPSVDFATYLKLSKKQPLNTFKDIDQQNQDLILKISEMFDALSSARKIRSEIVFKVGHAWLQMIKIKLNMNNINELLDVSAGINRLFASHEAYGKLKAAFEQRREILSKLPDLNSPNLYLKGVSEAVHFASKVQESIPHQNLAQSVKDEVSALVNNHIIYLDNMMAMAQSMVQKSPQYLAERKRIVRVISKRNEFVASQGCKDKAKRVLDNANPDLDSELDFIDYRNLCT